MSFDASVLDRLGLVAGLALSIKATVVLAIGAATWAPLAWLTRRTNWKRGEGESNADCGLRIADCGQHET